MSEFRICAGLPTYGDPAQAFPASFAAVGRGDLVVEFLPGSPNSWIGNFRRVREGAGGFEGVLLVANSRAIGVFAGGHCYVIDPDTRALLSEFGEGGINQVWEVSEPPGIIVEMQGLYFMRIGAAGTVWCTRRLSWDGFEDVSLVGPHLEGLAWALGGWEPFSVDVTTGRSSGGANIAGIPWDIEQLSEG